MSEMMTDNVVKFEVIGTQIGALYRLAKKSTTEAAVHLIEVGQRLLEKKRTTPHGEWLRWLKVNREILGFDERVAQRLLRLGKAKYEVNAVFDEIEALQIIRSVWGNGNDPRGTFGTGENEWHTPDAYLALARKVLGDIDLDPASHEKAQERVKAKKFFTAEDDGLSREWHGRVWLNPPYAQPLIAQFVEKLCEEFTARRVTAAIMLTHNYTDTEWFQTAALFASSICFTRGRIRFIDLDGGLAAPTQGQAFCYFGSQTGKFTTAFNEVGFVMARKR